MALSLLDDSGPSPDTCFDTLALSLLPFPLPFSQCTRKTPSTYIHTSFISDLVPAKSVAVNKMSRQIELANTGHIVRGHVAIITKPSPPFPVRDIVLIPGLLPIFLHSCEIKSGSGLRTRLHVRTYPTYCMVPEC